MFSSCRDTLSHSIASKKGHFSGEKGLYFDQFTDFENFLDSKWLLYPWIYLQKTILQNFLSPHQKFGRYFFILIFIFQRSILHGMAKERNFLHVVDLSFDGRFLKYYYFSLHYHKQCPINNVKVKYLQIGQNVSDIF